MRDAGGRLLFFPSDTRMEYCGRVIRKPFGVGSKSERDAVMIVTDAGEFVLRREGGNPFRDAALEKLVGRTICCEGAVHGYTLIMSKWRETGDDAKA